MKSLLVAGGSSAGPGAGRSGKVAKAACCAGSGGSLHKAASQGGAALYLTGEMRHHEALAASAAGMTCVCLGHWRSERMALAALRRRLRKKLPELRVTISRHDKGPLHIA